MLEFPVVSLFSGAGGLDLGLERADPDRVNIRASVEIDPDARKTLLRNNLASPESIFNDITDISADTLMQAAQLAEGETFLLAGGPPCQAFSTAGLRQGIHGSGAVVHNYFHMVEKLRPRYFVFENVRGLLSAALAHRPLADRLSPKEIPSDPNAALGSVMERLILPTFKKLGYEVVFGILNSADYGAAQIRHRVVMLGSRDKEFGAVVFRKQTSRAMMSLDLIPPTHHRTARYGGLQPWRTIGDVIGQQSFRNPSAQDAYTYSSERAAVFANVPPGKNWKYLKADPNFGESYLERWMGAAALKSGGGKEGYYRRLTWSRPAPTLTAQPQQLASSLCHPEEDRPLSIPEYAALQDFPDDFEFVGSKSSRYRQIGNAVPVSMAEAIGRAIIDISKVNDSDNSAR
ncbi:MULTISPECIES: DNA cytosine methyltransferase [unclassified Curtobacterium]|uniref:DNA cytosine methyltransferase n=1 Tax=unclassified Curtobacterium TaxID=257496 RepID=UPI0009F41447|nr:MULTISPECIES: DNA cytosine methyltransferase [unclassified Curtobacterium]WIB01269.1 DNA cytosine methyltransferase [Curtobacterium sp. MCBA15_012]